MKQFNVALLIISIFTTCNAQIDNTSQDYEKGKHILSQTRKNIENNKGEKNYVDYWNLAKGIALTEGDKEKVHTLLLKSCKDDAFSFYDITQLDISFVDNDIKNTTFYKLLGDGYIDIVKDAQMMSSKKEETEEKVDNIINQVVVDELIEMMKIDQRYRQLGNAYRINKLKQDSLDAINQKRLIELFSTYGYPGKSITGDNKYKDYTCLIVEHGQNLTDQKKWLLIIAEAYRNGELSVGPLKMLLDRIHWKEVGKQYFGSHVGIPFEPNEEIQRVKLKYGIE